MDVLPAVLLVLIAKQCDLSVIRHIGLVVLESDLDPSLPLEAKHRSCIFCAV